MEIWRKNDSRLAVQMGKKNPDPVLPAMPIQIQFAGIEMDYTLEKKQDAHYFKMNIPEERTPGWAFKVKWDTFALRTAFEQLKTPEDAWQFLNVTGPFRFIRSGFKRKDLFTWRELQGWQEIVRRLRLRSASEGFPMLAARGPHCKDFFLECLSVAGLDEYLDQIWSVSDETFGWLIGIPTGLSIRRDMYLERREIEDIFSSPGATIADSRAWHQAQEVLARRRAERARGNPDGKQKLVAEVVVGTVLEAILATVYIDKLCGLDLQVCALKECNETFVKVSDHGKQYCSQYHAHLASIRRKRTEAKQERDAKKGKSQ